METQAQLRPPPMTPSLVMGGAGFSYQLHRDPKALPIKDILMRAFDLNVRTIDTSPYYEPSEQLLGEALSDADVKARYARSDYAIMTKVGRITEHESDYSPAWIRSSVARSLKRFHTTYLDVVFCHDVELVSQEDAIEAVGVLLELQQAGVILRVGISGYAIDRLAEIAEKARQRYGRAVDVAQVWAQLTLQNTQAEQRGFHKFRAAGIQTVFCSSPLAVGLLRRGGIPVGLTGDWHPAPKGLREASAEAAEWVEQHGDEEPLSSVALQYAVAKAKLNCSGSFGVSTITGISTVSDLEQNVASVTQMLKADASAPKESTQTLEHYHELDCEAWHRKQPIFEHIRSLLGQWIDYDFSSNESSEISKAAAQSDTRVLKPEMVRVQVVERESAVVGRSVEIAV